MTVVSDGIAASYFTRYHAGQSDKKATSKVTMPVTGQSAESQPHFTIFLAHTIIHIANALSPGPFQKIISAADLPRL